MHNFYKPYHKNTYMHTCVYDSIYNSETLEHYSEDHTKIIIKLFALL